MPWFEQKMGTFRAGLVIGHVEGKMCMFYRHKQGEKSKSYLNLVPPPLKKKYLFDMVLIYDGNSEHVAPHA